MVAMAGCIRDKIEPCPPLTVTLEVTDKNWFNIDEVAAEGLAEPMDENLPFREFVQSLSYELIDVETGDPVASGVYDVTHDGQTETLSFDGALPFGQYELVVWGNVSSIPGKSSLSTDGVMLHEDGKWGADNVYHYAGILDYNYDSAFYSAGLERTVGCLLVEATELPSGMDFSIKDVDGVHGTVGKGFVYDVPESVHTELDWGADATSVKTETCLGPTPDGDDASLTIKFRDMDLYVEGETGWPYEIASDPVDITMERNRMTVIKYNYEADGFHIMILVNGQWEQMHQMGID